MSVWALVAAAGKGSRAGLGMNKAFYPLRGRTVLETCLRGVRAAGIFDGVAVVLSKEDRPMFEGLGLGALADAVAVGGATRQESVLNGLLALPKDTQIVAVHDAARPFAAPELFRASVESARAYGSGVVCTPVTDTVKQIGEDGRVSTPDRASLRAVQTPQTFDYPMLLSAYERARRDGFSATDDASLFERAYGTVRLIAPDGAERNRKLTLPEDFAAPRREIAFRVGTGFDAHRLKAGRPLVLGGVEIPWEKGLDGHSDADAALHALMDAMLGALAMGDIGQHFPDTDPAYEGASSLVLLAETNRLLLDMGWRVGNADVTIVAQRPKLAPFIPHMRERIAGALGVPADCVSVKATTTEGMGFEGEGIGMSAQAGVLIVRDTEEET